MEHRPAGPDHHRRPGDVLGPGLLVERTAQRSEVGHDLGLRPDLPPVSRGVGGDRSPDRSDET
jgi:hypothetical protein